MSELIKSRKELTIRQRAGLVASGAALTLAAATGWSLTAGAEGVPCDPVIDGECTPDPSTSEYPDLTKPSVPETSTTTTEGTTTSTTTTQPEITTTTTQPETTTTTTTPGETTTTTTPTETTTPAPDAPTPTAPYVPEAPVEVTS